MRRGRAKLPLDPAAVEVMSRLRKRSDMVRRIATELNLTTWSVQRWKVVPLERVIDVERATGIRRDVLRPDFHLPVLSPIAAE